MSDILDLGTLDLPLMFFGGPYGNLQALQALRAEAERRGLRPDQVICTGDVVAYCGAPADTVALVRDWGIPVVQGNVEEQIGANAGDCACGYEEGSACDVLSRTWYAACVAALTPDDAIWMAGRPKALRFEAGGLRFGVVHGGLEQNNQLMFSSTESAEMQRQIDTLGVDVIVAGHIGLPFTRSFGDAIWHNAAVIGMPANDGTPDTWFSTVEATQEGIALVHHRLTYDHAAAAADTARNGFPGAYAKTLESGLWPSIDILPETEQGMTGVRLDPPGAIIEAANAVQSPATKKCQVPSGPIPSL